MNLEQVQIQECVQRELERSINEDWKYSKRLINVYKTEREREREREMYIRCCDCLRESKSSTLIRVLIHEKPQLKPLLSPLSPFAPSPFLHLLMIRERERETLVIKWNFGLFEQLHQLMQKNFYFTPLKPIFSILPFHFYKTPTSICLYTHLFK